MFQRFHAMKEERESGFTLIELLVVILIIAILAAIAIPVFLNQRKKGWVAQMESGVKNGATAAESVATGAQGSYATVSSTTLTTEGWKYASTLVPTVTADADSYCISVEHTQLGAPGGVKHISITESITVPTKTSQACQANGVMGTANAWTP
jgi:type IV pilus assembly protein PilA